MRPVKQKPPKKDHKALYSALLKLQTLEEMQSFLADLCTPGELDALADRWEVARLLERGVPYREIYDRTGVSTATVTRVARALLHGMGGYQRALNQNKESERN